MHSGCMYACACVLTREARRGRIGLDILLSVALNHVPECPHVAGVKNVKGLVWIELAVLLVWTKKVEVWTVIPLMKKERQTTKSNPLMKTLSGLLLTLIPLGF